MFSLARAPLDDGQGKSSTPGETRTPAHGSGGRCSNPLSYRGVTRASLTQARQFRKSVQAQQDLLDLLQPRAHNLGVFSVREMPQVRVEMIVRALVQFEMVRQQARLA